MYACLLLSSLLFFPKRDFGWVAPVNQKTLVFFASTGRKPGKEVEIRMTNPERACFFPNETWVGWRHAKKKTETRKIKEEETIRETHRMALKARNISGICIEALCGALQM